MTATRNVVYNNLGVKLTGVNPTGSVEFDLHLDVGDQMTHLSASRWQRQLATTEQQHQFGYTPWYLFH